MSRGGSRAAVFLDRDGVITRDNGYTHRVEDFELLPGVVKELRRLRSLEYLLIVVTNQAGVARGYYTESDYEAFTRHMRLELGAQGVILDGVYHCPHNVEGVVGDYSIECDCRKPRPGMLLQAIRDHDLDVSRCWLVGDKTSDIEAGVAAGIPSAQCLRVTGNLGLSPIAGHIGA